MMGLHIILRRTLDHAALPAMEQMMKSTLHGTDYRLLCPLVCFLSFSVTSYPLCNTYLLMFSTLAEYAPLPNFLGAVALRSGFVYIQSSEISLHDTGNEMKAMNSANPFLVSNRVKTVDSCVAFEEAFGSRPGLILVFTTSVEALKIKFEGAGAAAIAHHSQSLLDFQVRIADILARYGRNICFEVAIHKPAAERAREVRKILGEWLHNQKEKAKQRLAAHTWYENVYAPRILELERLDVAAATNRRRRNRRLAPGRRWVRRNSGIWRTLWRRRLEESSSEEENSSEGEVEEDVNEDLAVYNLSESEPDV